MFVLEDDGKITLDNGRSYLVIDTHQPYEKGVYPKGGIVVKLLHKGEWVYLETVPDKETLQQLLKFLSRLDPLA